MALALATSPAAVSSSTVTATTASYTPPANTLLVAVVGVGNPSGTATVTTGAVTDSLGSTWTLKKRQNSTSGTGSAEVWMMDAGASPAARTITLTGSKKGTLLAVTAFTGAAPTASQTGATAGSVTTTANTLSITPIATGSYIVGSASDSVVAYSMVAAASTTLLGALNDATNGGCYGAWRSTATTTTTTAQTYGLTPAPTNETEKVAVEVLASTGGTALTVSAALTGSGALSGAGYPGRLLVSNLGSIATDATRPTTANSNMSADANNTAPTITSSLDLAPPHTGSVSVQKFTTTTGVAALVGWDTAKWTPGTPVGAVVYGRFYLYVPSAPGGTVGLAAVANTAWSQGLSVRLTTGMKLQVWGTGSILLGTTSTTIPTGQWVRVEFRTLIDATSGQGIVRVFTDPEAATPTETFTSTAGNTSTSSGLTSISRVGIGNIGTGTTATYYLADVVWDDTDWVGPFAQTGAAASDPAVSTLTDDFTTQDATKWGGWSAGAVDWLSAAKQVQITCATNYYALFSASTYTLANSSAYVQLAQVPNVGNGTTEVFFQLSDTTGTNNVLAFGVNSGSLYLREQVGGVNSDTTVAYNATSMRWLRLRHDGTNVYWETSPDAATWTVQRTKVPAIPIGKMLLRLTAGYYGTETTPGTAIFDNVNIAGGAPALTATAALTGSGALSATVTPRATITAALTGSGALTATTSASGGPYRAAVTTDAPTVWWHLDEASGTTLADAVGGRTLTISGSPTLGSASIAANDAGTTSITFNNSTLQYAETPAHAAFASATITVEALVQTNGFNGNNRIIEFGADAAWALFYENGVLKFNVFGHGSANYTWAGNTARHHVVGTYDAATGATRLYLDGAEVANQTTGGVAGTYSATTDPLRLAQKPTGAVLGDGWNGRLDEVAIYSTVLTPARIAAHSSAAGLNAAALSASAALTGSGSLAATATKGGGGGGGATQTDTFTGANGAAPSAANWIVTPSTGSTATIQSNALSLVTGTAGAYADSIRLTSTLAAAADVEVTLDVTPASATVEAYLDIMLRSPGTGGTLHQAGYKFEVGNGGSASIQRVAAYSGTVLGTSATVAGFGAGVTVHIDAQIAGSTLTLWAWTGATKPSTPTVQVTDTTYSAAGQVGFYLNGGNAAGAPANWTADNWTATVGGGGGTTALTATAALTGTGTLAATTSATQGGGATGTAAAALTGTGTLTATTTATQSGGGGGTPTVTPGPGTTVSVNAPERGAFYYSETHYTSSNTGYAPLTDSAVASAVAAGQTQVFRYFYMEKYLSQDAIDQTYLNLVAADLAIVRNNGAKAIIRFAYSNNDVETYPYGNPDPPVARVQAHIAALAPTLNANADVIEAVEAGFIGIWGEWYYTVNYSAGTDPNVLSAQNWIDRKAILTALLSNLDARIFVLVRYAGIKPNFFGGTTVPADPTQAGYWVRMGYHDDALGATADDWGTFITFPWSGWSDPLNNSKAFVASDTATYPLPWGGEMGSNNVTYAAFKAEMSQFHANFWNPSDFGGSQSAQGWTAANQTEIRQLLGHRLRLVSSSVVTNLGTGASTTVSVTVANDGWGRPLRQFPVWVDFVPTGGGQATSTLLTGVDPRAWAPGGQYTISGSVTAPSTAGAYTVHLRITDPSAGLASRAAYSVPLVNTGTYDASTGRNALGVTATVTAGGSTALTVAAALTGSGALTATTSATQGNARTVSAALAGSGSLVTTQTPRGALTVALTGAGTVGAVGVRGGAATLARAIAYRVVNGSWVASTVQRL